LKRSIKGKWKVTTNVVSSVHTASAVLPQGYFEDFDPFLLLMEDRFGYGAFDKHPHRGIETVTLILDGEIDHFDSVTGAGGTLTAGDFQLMTAGKGVIHNESPAKDGRVHLLQLWLNLPRQHKMTAPRYQNLLASDVPNFLSQNVLVKVYSGQCNGVSSPLSHFVPFDFLDVTMMSDSSFLHGLPASYNGFVYVLEGEAQFGVEKVLASKGEVLWLGDAEGETSEITISTLTNTRFVLFAGEPIMEPIVARGPFVMNTEEEIKQAYSDYRTGKFLI
jgi:quercetin 2,3-dioxygenase